MKELSVLALWNVSMDVTESDVSLRTDEFCSSLRIPLSDLKQFSFRLTIFPLAKNLPSKQSS